MFTLIYGLVIALYCYSPKIAILPLLFIIIKELLKKENLNSKIISVLILLLPFSSCNIFLNGYSTYFSLFDIFLYFYLFLSMKRMKIEKNNITFLSVLSIIYIILKLFTAQYIQASIGTSISVIIMLLCILIPNNKERKTESEVAHYIKLYIKVGLSTSIALMISYLLYQRGIEIGNIATFGNDPSNMRVNFNLLYTSYSYLSAYLASGAVALLCYRSITKLTLKDFFQLAIFLVGILISSSRTGLAVIFVIALLMYFKTLNFRKISLKQLGILIVGCIFVIISWNVLIALRPEASDFLEGFGRVERWQYAFDIFKQYPLFGYGFYDDVDILPLAHNFILEYLSEGGIIFTVLFLSLIFCLSVRWKHNPYRFIFYSILVANLLFTCLQSDKFLYVIFMILFAYPPIKKEGETE